MKLIIQIPCHNEAQTLPETVKALPRKLTGVEQIEILVVDDGSVDGTADVARELGVDHVVRLPARSGLAQAFSVGLTESLRRGADIIVNTDGDNQYYGPDVERLLEPILQGRAQMVIGARSIEEIEHFSRSKKRLQRLGSWAVRMISAADAPDATSGFRAFSREAALRINVFSSYTYTLETIIQAGRCNIAIESVPVRINRPLRESRLIKSIPSYLRISAWTMLRVFLLYKPLRLFGLLGGAVFAVGFLIGLRFVIFYLLGEGEGRIQSLILAAVLLIMGFQLGILGLVADLISTNRRILEEIQHRQRKQELDSAKS